MLACVIFIKATLLRSLKISLSPLHRSTLSTSSGLSSETPVWEKTSFPLSQMGCRRLCWDSPLLSGQSVHTSLQSLPLFFCLFVFFTKMELIFFFFLLFQVRNSSTLLFSTLITRIFGVKKGKDEHSKKNRSLSSVSCCLLTQGGAVAPAPRLKRRLWWRSRF